LAISLSILRYITPRGCAGGATVSCGSGGSGNDGLCEPGSSADGEATNSQPGSRDLKRGDSSKSEWSDTSDLEFVDGDGLLGAFDSMQMVEGDPEGDVDQGESLESLVSHGSMPLM
jgi:hypothetical protein